MPRELELKAGSDFNICGALYRIVGIEKDTIIYKNIRTDKVYSYGLRAFEKIMEQWGYKMVMEK